MSEPTPIRPRQKRRATVLDKNDPLSAAIVYTSRHAVGNELGLVTVGGETYRWRSNWWEPYPADEVNADLWLWAHDCIDDKGEPFKPTKAKTADQLAALAAYTHIQATDGPRWLRHLDGDHDPIDLIVCRNGILHARTRELLPATPRLFTVNVLPIEADPLAPAPIKWLEFLDQVFAGDREAIELLQEWIALSALTRDTSHQKALLIIGPKRSGKGTILRILLALAGAANVCSPTFGSLGNQFGLQPLIGKLVALLSDARLSSRTDLAVLAETFLRITGEDAVTVPRKFQSDWTGTLPVRFTVVSNELPNLADASGALASRFLILQLSRSFFGAEDHALTDKLLAELPGILNWALDGLDRLRTRGRFIQPASGKGLVEELENLSSPVKQFMRDCCVLDPQATGRADTLFDRWRDWCKDQGRDHPGTSAQFGKALRSAEIKGFRHANPRIGGKQVLHYAGIRLRTITDP